jgi:hypothetical protein
MYRRIGDTGGAVLGYRLSGRLTEEEVREIQREMDAAIEEHGSVRVLCEMGDFSGAEPGAVWQDLKFTSRYVRDMERFALVGDERWHKVLAELSDALGVAEAEFFELSRLDEAWDWLRGRGGKPGAEGQGGGRAGER